MSEASQQSENGHRRVKIQSGGEADRGQQSKQFTGRNLENVEHFCLESPQRLKPLDSGTVYRRSEGAAPPKLSPECRWRIASCARRPVGESRRVRPSQAPFTSLHKNRKAAPSAAERP